MLGILYTRLQGKACRPFSSDAKVRIELSDHVRFYYPDAQVVCEANSGTQHYQERPVVIVEILSESTRRADLGEKRDAYLAIPSLKVLLLVDSESPCILVYRRRPAGGFAAEEYREAAAVVDLSEIGAALPAAEVYQGITFGGRNPDS